MNLSHLNFLIFSSHKTSTQSLVHILNSSKYRTIHCHKITDFRITLKYTDEITNEKFIKALEDYKTNKNKKLKIITIIRNPKQRIPSSFFQTYHTDEVMYLNKNEDETTISTHNLDELYNMFTTNITNNELNGNSESIDEITKIFDCDIITNLEKKDDYYYYQHDLFELFVLDFNKIIDENNLKYINTVLNIRCKYNSKENLSENKTYYQKYIEFKNMITPEINDIIEKNYNSFYFTAFSQ
jgi:hypothetical protein